MCNIRNCLDRTSDYNLIDRVEIQLSVSISPTAGCKTDSILSYVAFYVAVCTLLLKWVEIITTKPYTTITLY